MKKFLTKTRVAEFEVEQASLGTKTALHNVIWDFLFDAYGRIGVLSLETKYKKDKKK